VLPYLKGTESNARSVMRVLLTDRFVAGAKGDGSRQVEFFDAKTKGLSLRVSRKGVKSWSFSFTASEGKRARLTLGSYPAVTLAAARGLALEAQATVQSGQDPRMHKAGAMTLAALIEHYVAKHVRNLRSAKQVERRFLRNVIPVIGSVRLADLHRRDINRAVDAVTDRVVRLKRIACSATCGRRCVGRSLAVTLTAIQWKACRRPRQHATGIGS
jgi:hypothetical protein